MRNIAKINPKKAKKQPFFDFFWFSRKLFIRFELNLVQSFYTILWSFVCNFIHFVLLRCEQHHKKLAQKWPKNSQFSTFLIFAKFVQTIRTTFSTDLVRHIRVPYVQWHQNRMALSWEMSQISPKNGQKTVIFRLLPIFSKTVRTIQTIFSTVIPRHTMVIYVQFQ